MSDGNEIMDGLSYAETHEWIKIEVDVAIVGITDYAQHTLGDIVGVELPSVGDSFDAGDSIGMLDSVKSSTDVFTPVAGEVIEVNDALENEPEIIQRSPYGDGYLVKLRISEKPQGLMSPEEYKEFLKNQE